MPARPQRPFRAPIAMHHARTCTAAALLMVAAPAMAAAPDTLLGSHPPAHSSTGSATFTFSSDDGAATFVCGVDGAPFAACSSPMTLSGLTEGLHQFEVAAVNGALEQDPSPAAWSWSVDTTSPPAPQVTSPVHGGITSNPLPVATGNAEPDATVTLTLDGSAAGSAPADASGSWAIAVAAPLADGPHTVKATAADAAGNLSPDSSTHTFSVDTAAPQTTITAGPQPLTNQSAASFQFSADEAGASYQCSLDGAPYTACTAPLTLTGLADGGHSFAVRAVDVAGNPDATPATHTWQIDTTAPAAPLITSPAEGAQLNTPTPQFAGSAEANAGVRLSLDGGAAITATADAAGNFALTAATLADGPHQLQATARDAAGNDSPAVTVSFTIDTIAPQTQLTATPPPLTSSTEASFGLAADDPSASFECTLDGAPFAACATPQAMSHLGEGPHHFSARARDAAGNVDATPATHTWQVDTLAPETTLVSGPPAETAATSAEIAFSSPEAGATFECRLDGGPFAACASPVSLTGLAVGEHGFAVRARDAAGNTDATPAALAWRVTAATPVPLLAPSALGAMALLLGTLAGGRLRRHRARRS